MKHIAIIQAEFLKEARKWDDLSFGEQKRYLQKHPKSKRRITAKPTFNKEKGTEQDLLTVEKRLSQDYPHLEFEVQEMYSNGDYALTVDDDNELVPGTMSQDGKFTFMMRRDLEEQLNKGPQEMAVS